MSIATSKPGDNADNAPGIAFLDAAGRIDAANAAFDALVRAASAGRRLSGFIAPTESQVVADWLGRALDGGAPPAMDVRLKTGTLVELHAGPQDVARGRLAVCLMDTARQKALEAQSAQAQKMQAVGQLAGGIAHDFNNLLTAILGSCDLANAKKTTPEIGEIKRHAERGADLIRQILAFSRRQKLNLRVLSLTEVIEGLREWLTRLLGVPVALETDYAPDLWPVRADDTQIAQLVINLAVNARDAMPEGGRLVIRLSNVSRAEARARNHALMPPADYVLCAVEDTGHGIAPDALGKIFEPFFSNKEGGTGLGLSTVYGIVKQTGGFIFPDAARRRGAAFHIYLPRYKGRSHPPRHRASDATTDAAPPPSATILLVEDDLAVRSVAARALVAQGYRLLEAESGEAALALASRETRAIDVIVSDVVMPGMDGAELLQKLRRRKQTAHLRAVLTSGYAESALRERLDKARGVRFLPKPFGLKQLADAVKDVLGAPPTPPKRKKS